MAKISDEIRKWCADLDSEDILCTTETLYTLADRIDRELVELPKSADGKIWTGRETCFWTGATEEYRHEFNSLAYINGRWCVEDNDFERYPAVSVWYERPDSWERIADELEAWCDDVDVDGDACGVPRELARRIRRLAEGEASNGTD
jgi:hypothetical protein